LGENATPQSFIRCSSALTTSKQASSTAATSHTAWSFVVMGSVAELKDGMNTSYHINAWAVGYYVLILPVFVVGVAAVKDALQRKGLLPQLQANVRSQIFNALLDSEVSSICLPAVGRHTKAAAQHQGTTANILQMLLLLTCV
jgi:hypothetical protein